MTFKNAKHWNRREVLASAVAVGLSPVLVSASEERMLRRPVPASDNETLPVIGIGTYEVFDVAGSAAEIAEREELLRLLTQAGGSVVDTSPMYRRSEDVIGQLIRQRGARDDLFLATKVWTDGAEAGRRQMQRSAELMHTKTIDLMQVHNLRDTDVHMRSIRELQESGQIRYSGLTHYRADALPALEAQMKQFKPQFIQINYSLGEREADQRLLPLAADMGVAVIANRPYQGGALFRAVRGRELPGWAADFAPSWGQFFLKYIVSHPAVTCAIPATSKAAHMRDNVQAGFGELPDTAMRKRMVEFIRTL